MSDAPLTPEQIAQQEARAAKEGYVRRLPVDLDIAIDEAADGPMDETISSRVRRISDAHPKWGLNPGVWLAKALNAGLNLVQSNHGAKAEAGDLERAQNEVAIEEKAEKQ